MTTSLLIVDVGKLLGQARSRAQLSRTELARAGRVSRSALHRYETGGASPPVAVLDQLLAACHLQARVTLEPLYADVDERVHRFVHGGGRVPFEELEVLLADAGQAGVRWALDGASALEAQGFSVGERPENALEVVVPLEDATRTWLYRHNARAVDQDGRWNYRTWLALSDDEALSCRPPLFIVPGSGVVLARVTAELPECLALAVPWTPPVVDPLAGAFDLLPDVLEAAPPSPTPASGPDTAPQPEPPHPLVVPVLPLHAVEQAHPLWAELLSRWRGLGCPAPGGAVQG